MEDVVGNRINVATDNKNWMLIMIVRKKNNNTIGTFVSLFVGRFRLVGGMIGRKEKQVILFFC